MLVRPVVKTETTTFVVSTYPTAGISTKAATVSLVVVIAKPDAAAAAALAARVMPPHVTVTAPAASVLSVARVSVMVCGSATIADVVDFPDGDVMAHLSLASVVT